MKTYVNIGEMLVRGDELLFKSLFLKDSSTFIATVILFLFFSTVFFRSSPYRGSFTLYNIFQVISFVHLSII